MNDDTRRRSDKPATSGTPRTMTPQTGLSRTSSPEEMRLRREAKRRLQRAGLLKILQKTYRVCHQDLPAPMELEKMLDDWEEIAEPIPVERLNDAYLHAMRTRTDFGLLKPQELFAAWRSLQSAESVRAGGEYRLAEPEGGIASPDERVEILRAALAESSAKRGEAFRSAADVATSVPPVEAARSAPVECRDCGFGYDATRFPLGCPRCALRQQGGAA